MMSASEELIELVRKLKRERSFVYAEQKHIREHYTQVLMHFAVFRDGDRTIFFLAS